MVHLIVLNKLKKTPCHNNAKCSYDHFCTNIFSRTKYRFKQNIYLNKFQFIFGCTDYMPMLYSNNQL